MSDVNFNENFAITNFIKSDLYVKKYLVPGWFSQQYNSVFLSPSYGPTQPKINYLFIDSYTLIIIKSGRGW